MGRLRRVRLLLLALAVVSVAPHARGQSILTVAGGGTDDGRLATRAALRWPVGAVSDTAGNIFIADTGNDRIRRVDSATGTISTVAGIGSSSFSGDGGPATAAALQAPYSLALDAATNIFVADTNNHRIRRIDARTGIISTVAGNGSWGFSGDGGPATGAALSSPSGVAVDAAGNVLVADTGNHRVRRIDGRTGVISTVAGNGSEGSYGDGGPATAAALRHPSGVGVDGAGNILVADRMNHRIRQIDAATGFISTIAGSGTQGFSGDGGPATAATLSVPSGVVADAAGDVYVADCTNNRIRRIHVATGIITTVVGNGSMAFGGDGGPATAAALGYPSGISVDAAGNILIADSHNNRIRRVCLATGVISTVAGNGLRGFSGDGEMATSAALQYPTGVAFEAAGSILIADAHSSRIRRVDPMTRVISTAAGNGTEGFSGDGGPATASALNWPYGVAVSAAESIFIADRYNRRVRRIDGTSGYISTIAGNGAGGFAGDGGPAAEAVLGQPHGVAVDIEGNVFIADSENHRIRRVGATTGIISTVAGNGIRRFSGDGGPATEAALGWPYGVAVDTAGHVFVADTQNHRIRRIDAHTGSISSVAGNGSWGFSGDGGPATAAMLRFPHGVAVDATGNVLIADSENHRIRRVDASTGIVSTVAGNGTASFTGDGGSATSGTLAYPWGVAVDAAGNILIADTNNNRVRAVFACVTVSPPSLSAPADGATGVATGPTLSWSAVPGAFRYDVYLGTASPPATVVASDLVATSFTAANLSPGVRYSWKVVAKGDPFCVPPSSAESVVRSFTTAGGCTPPAAVVLTAPDDGARVPASAATLSWAASSGAGSYDVFFGATNPPPLAAPGLTSTSWTPSGLDGGGLYYWSVLAHAACDPSKTSASSVRSFRIEGVGCFPPGTFSLSTPADGATGLPPDLTVSWSPSPGAASYDLYLGLTASPPLYLSGLTSTSRALAGLSTGSTYRWKVVARASCDPGAATATPVRSFTVAGTCVTPAATSFTFAPPGNVGAGQTYVLAWSAAPQLDRGGGYVVERSASASFAPVLDTVATTSLFASFVAPSPGPLHHRVRALPACDPAKAGPWSPTAVVSVVSAKSNVVFARAPEAVVVGLGDLLEVKKTTFTLENVTSAPLQVVVARQELASVPFFTIHDPAGGDAAFVTLEPRLPKTLELHYSGPPNDVPGAYQGLIVVAATGAGLAITPWAFVSLKVGSSPDAVPEFRFNGVATEYAAFPGVSGDDSARPSISVDVHNPGPSPLELAAEVGPEVWLDLEAGWNATPIPPGGSRTLRLSTRRVRAPNGSALPRYTYLTLRTKGGVTSRLLVQDNEAPLLSSGRGASAVRPEASFLGPSVAHVTSALGNTFVSRLSLSNAGTEAVQAELVFTPASSDASLVDGFGPAVRRATVVVPPNDVVRLPDPLVLLFGLAPPVAGTLEVRAAAERAGFLSVASSVDAPSASGGSFGFAIPVFRSGEGIRAGSSAAITAVASDAVERTNLILAETTGVDEARAKVSLYDASGTLRGAEALTVPRWGQRQLSAVVQRLGGAAGSRAGRLEIAVESGGGTLAAVTTVVDNANDDAAAFSARAVETAGTAARSLRALAPAWARATGTVKSLVPALVNGYQTFPASAAPFTFRSVLGFANIASAEAVYRLTYYDLASGATLAREVRVPGRKTVEYTNVLEQLFGVGTGVKSQGPLFVESDLNGLLWCRVASSLDAGTIGDSFPVIPIPSESLSGAGTARLIGLDGLEQSVDRSRGTRSNLILNEVLGRSVTLRVSLYEAGNRSSPIAERDLTLGPLEKLQLSTVFAELGLDSAARRKDRTNVLCTVRALSGDGLASAVVTTIDNRTGDTRNVPLAPTSAGAGGATIGF